MLKNKFKSIFLSPINTSVLAAVIVGVLVFRDCFFESYRIPTTSMVPTLLVGDYIIVSKLEFKLKIPFTNIAIVNFDRPKRGEVVVFKYPKDRSTDFIKRVIALEGDTVEVKNNVLYINGEEEKLNKIPTPEKMQGFSYYRSEKYAYTIRFLDSNYLKADMNKRTIGKDKVFVLGDNRDYSYDSRFWGEVNMHDIIGSPKLIWFSAYFGKDGEIKVNRNRFMKQLD